MGRESLKCHLLLRRYHGLGSFDNGDCPEITPVISVTDSPAFDPETFTTSDIRGYINEIHHIFLYWSVRDGF